MILNRRALLAAIGLSIPAIATAEAATTKKKQRKPKPATGPKTAASHKPRRNTRTPAPTQS